MSCRALYGHSISTWGVVVVSPIELSWSSSSLLPPPPSSSSSSSPSPVLELIEIPDFQKFVAEEAQSAMAAEAELVSHYHHLSN